MSFFDTLTNEEIQLIFSDYYNSMKNELDKLAEELISAYKLSNVEKELLQKITQDVAYFRTRSRWNLEAEAQLINDGKEGIFHNMGEF